MKYAYTSYNMDLIFIIDYTKNETFILVRRDQNSYWKQMDQNSYWKQIENYFKPNYYSDEIGLTTEEYEFLKQNPEIWV